MGIIKGENSLLQVKESFIFYITFCKASLFIFLKDFFDGNVKKLNLSKILLNC